jgi:hypothetical protein
MFVTARTGSLGTHFIRALAAASIVAFSSFAAGCNRSDREPSPAPSAAPVAVPAATPPSESSSLVDAAPGASQQVAKTEPALASCTTDADCRAFADACPICSCRPLAKNAPDPKCIGKKMTCLIDPCGGLRALCRKGVCAIGDRGDAAPTTVDPPVDAAKGDVAIAKDAAAASDKSTDAATKGSGPATSPAASAASRPADAAARD